MVMNSMISVTALSDHWLTLFELSFTKVEDSAPSNHKSTLGAEEGRKLTLVSPPICGSNGR